MIKGIKILMEALFDDEINDVILDDNDNILNTQLLDNDFKKVILETLCVNTQYHYVEESEDLPYILQNPNNGIQFFIAPYLTLPYYKSKKKMQLAKENLAYYYRYILTFNKDGNIDLSSIISRQNAYQGESKCYINEQVGNFISESPYKIDSLTYHVIYNNIYNVYEGSFSNIGIFLPKLSKQFIDNFPEKIIPGFKSNNIYEKTLAKIFRKWCPDDASFIKLVRKLINNGLDIIDENNIVYTKDNIDEKANDLLSGSIDNVLNDKIKQHEEFVIGLLGEERVNKFNKLVQYLQNNNIKPYLYKLNTLRKDSKISLETIYKLRKENDFLIYNDDIDEDSYYNSDSRFISKIILYNMFYIMKKENMNEWKCDIDLEDCKQGYYYDEGTYGWEHNVDINTLPMRLNSVDKIYRLYYVIGKAILLFNGLYEYSRKLADKRGNKNIDNPLIILKERDINNFNKNNTDDISSLKFDVLTEQICELIDKKCKKFKIK